MHVWIRVITALLLTTALATTARANETATQIRQHAGEHRLLVLGEYHGTRETPLLVRQLVDDYSRDGWRWNCRTARTSRWPGTSLPRAMPMR